MRENVITLVCGPPGSGKTTYVNERRKPGDIVWDFDVIMSAITGMDIHQTPRAAVRFAKQMRDGFYREAMNSSGHRIWIIEACPTAAERLRFERDLRAGVILLDTPEHVCIERVRDRGAHWPELVTRWFAESGQHP